MLRVPPSGCLPSATGWLSSVIAQVTLLSGRGRGRPSGPTGFATTSSEPDPLTLPLSHAPIGVVVFAQPLTAPAALAPSARPAAPCSRRRRLTRPSFGWLTGAGQSTKQADGCQATPVGRTRRPPARP